MQGDKFDEQARLIVDLFDSGTICTMDVLQEAIATLARNSAGQHLGVCGKHPERLEVREEHPDPEHNPIGGVAVTRYCTLCVNERLIAEKQHDSH